MAAAPGKVNLCLFLGGVRADGRHALVTVFESVSLVDDVMLSESGGGEDVVECAGVSGPNLALDALRALRSRGWEAPPQRVEIVKRIPVAAGMGGGSSDAAAVLRLASRIAPIADRTLQEVAASLGADVPAQLTAGVSLGTGAGEIVEPLAALDAHAFVIVPLPHALSTADVYREADRLGLARPGEELSTLADRIRAGERAFGNDLEPASRSLCPAIGPALEALRGSGADHAFVCGSGPTCAGLWWGAEARMRAARAHEQLAASYPAATEATPVGPGDRLPGSPPS
jgi:4-diphosphocytidyl-2-C-methyl-D-erythritol kinase